MGARDDVFHNFPRRQRKIVQDLLNAEEKRAPNAFRHPEVRKEFFHYIVTPTCGRWAFKPNGKAATTLALAGLFALQFGCLPSTDVEDLSDQNKNAILHRLTSYDVFRFLLLRHEVTSLSEALQTTCYITTVRHPLSRAISAFSYLCVSHDRRHPQFAADRMRLTALTGFDWSQDTYTVEGMLKFLDYVDISSTGGARLVNNHWRAQADTIRPDLFPPDVIGRTEDMRSFFFTLQDRFNVPMPWLDQILTSRMNTGFRTDIGDLKKNTSIKRRVADVYACDFEAFGYDI